MNRRALHVAVMIASVWFAGGSPLGQMVVQPTGLPTVTADNEPWYLNGEPIMYAGNMYYPTGAQVFFNQTEMVRSGFYMGVPLYTRTTIEPYSVVYVPLEGGRLQPYQRPRTGELTGTAGSVPSTLPHPPATVPPRGLAAQAAGPPSQTTIEVPVQMPRPHVVPPALQSDPASGVGTTGRTIERPAHVRIGAPPEGTQSVFIEYAGQRWYPEGPPKPLDRKGLIRLADFHGFAVWAESPEATEIQIPVTIGSTLVVRYTLTRPKTPLR